MRGRFISRGQRCAKEDLNRVANGLMAGRNTLLHHENDDSYIAALGKRLRHCYDCALRGRNLP